MGSDETVNTPSTSREVDCLVNSCTAVACYDHRRDDDYMYYGDGEDEGDDAVDDHMGNRMSGLSIETSEGEADAELSDDVDPKKKKKKASVEEADDDDEDIVAMGLLRGVDCLSLPGTPARPVLTKEYACETEVRARHDGRARRRGGGGRDRSSSSLSHCRSSRKARESRLERAWEMRQCHRDDSHSGGSSPCVVVRPRGRGAAASCMCMDKDEVRACRDLGLELPCDWTVEIPPCAFHWAAAADISSGGDSPVRSWRTSSPGDDPREMKARLRVWAQAVALASASRLGS